MAAVGNEQTWPVLAQRAHTGNVRLHFFLKRRQWSQAGMDGRVRGSADGVDGVGEPLAAPAISTPGLPRTSGVPLAAERRTRKRCMFISCSGIIAVTRLGTDQ